MQSNLQSTNGTKLSDGHLDVLIVEDDRAHRVLMDHILKDAGRNVVQAENGVIALSKIEAGQHFDLVLMDWDMPKLDGLETVKAIREREVREGKPHLKVIAFTAHRQEGDREQCIAAGMDAYLPKDVWMPKWRDTLTKNLAAFIEGSLAADELESDIQTSLQHVDVDDVDPKEFDHNAFDSTRDLLKEDVGIAVDEYLEDAAAYIRQIGDGLENKDVELAAKGSHPLKSNSKSFGLAAVSKLAEAINALCEKPDDEAEAIQLARVLFPQLEAAFAYGEERLKGELQS